MTRVLLVFLVAACSTEQDKGGAGGATARGGNFAATDCGPSLRLAGDRLKLQGAGGRISFSLASGSNPCAVEGYVVGAQGTTSVARAGNNEFVIEDVPEGDKDIIVTGKTAGNTTHSVEPADIGGANLSMQGETEAGATGTIGIRVNDLPIAAGQTTTKSLRLGALGSIRGRATLAGQGDHTGVQVFVPGTSYSARTDASGNYEIAQVPPGRHNLRFEFTGYGHALLEGVDVLPGGVASAPDAVLFTGAGEGQIAILADDGTLRAELIPTLSSRVVRYVLQVQGSPRLMKVSEDGNFANIAWQPFRSTGAYTFKVSAEGGGRVTKKLSVRTLDGTTEGELERAVVVDLFPEARAQGVLTLASTDESGEPMLAIRAALTVPHNAVEMRLSTKADFVGAAWEPAAASKTIVVPEEGDYAVFAQFRDVDLVASDVFSGAVTVDLFPAGSLAFTVAQPVVSYPADPKFALSQIASPIKNGNAKLLIADNEALVGAVEIAYAATHTFDLGSKLAACGPRTLFIGARYRDPATGRNIVSDVRGTVDVRYKCADEIAAKGGQPRRRSAMGQGGGLIFDWSGYFGAAATTVGFSREVAEEGGIYDLATRKWTPISGLGRPAGRVDAKVWYRNGKFVVFGGYLPVGAGTSESETLTGGIYDPVARTWTKIQAPTPVDVSSESSPSYCDEIEEQLYYPHIAFTGNHIVAWGNTITEPGCENRHFSFSYDLTTSTWSSNGAAPEPRCPSDNWDTPVELGLVIGGKLLQWGGNQCYDTDGNYIQDVLEGGEVFDPATNTWTAMSTNGAPAKRTDHVAAWTGTEVLIWGGRSLTVDGNFTYDQMNTGAIYNPATDSWRAMAASPQGTDLAYGTYYLGKIAQHPMVMRSFFTGGRLIVWGGEAEGQHRSEGMVFNYSPTGQGSWARIPAAGAPDEATKVALDLTASTPFFHNMDDAFLVGGKLYVWKRATTATGLSDAAKLFAEYDPAANKWTALPLATADRAAAVPSAFFRNFPYVFPIDDGVVFYGGRDPATDDWRLAPNYQTGVVHKLR